MDRFFNWKPVIVVIMMLCVFLYWTPVTAESTEIPVDSQAVQTGIVSVDRDTRCYYYTIPEDTLKNRRGFFLSGVKLKVYSYNDDWYVFEMGNNYYIKKESIRIASPMDSLSPIGYAFVSYTEGNQDVDPNGFVELLVDCDTTKPGTPVVIGQPLLLYEHIADLLEVGFDDSIGFVKKELVEIMYFKDLFSDVTSEITLRTGKYQTGVDLLSGLYRVCLKDSHDTTGSIVLKKREKELAFQITQRDRCNFIIYLPEDTLLLLSTSMNLSQVVTNEQSKQHYTEGRYLCGVDIRSSPSTSYTIAASKAEDSYFIVSSIWKDGQLASGEKQFLTSSEVRDVYLHEGEIIETHNCIINEKVIPG